MRRLVTRIKNFLAGATTSASPAPGPASFFHKLLGDAVPLTHLGDIQRAKVLQYFATDSSERLLRLEQRLRSNEDAECFQMLADIRRHIAAGSRAAHVPALEQQLRTRGGSLDPRDERHILCDSLLQLLAGDPEQMADQTFLYTMLRMVRYGGPFVDEVRRNERAWHEARLSWWVREGARLADMALVHIDEAAAGVPEQASMHSMLHRSPRRGASRR